VPVSEAETPSFNLLGIYRESRKERGDVKERRGEAEGVGVGWVCKKPP